MIKWGIVGLGNMANVFAKAVNEVDNSKLLSIASRSNHKLNTFQLEALSKIVLKKKVKSFSLLNSQSTLSKAQKYRCLKELVNKGLCKKKHNLFYTF